MVYHKQQSIVHAEELDHWWKGSRHGHTCAVVRHTDGEGAHVDLV